VFILFV